ncbi:ferritin-like domain-containing protein [Marinoscillum sp.]|uniref:YciE/YciF ferroxidase family protein n=1 Tax=Marinoscillum sp. TaxID=2024838 RepID=UPI003BAA8E6C
MRTILDLHDLLVEQLRELYDAELYLREALPQLKENAWHTGLRNVLDQYEAHVTESSMTLLQVFNDLFTIEFGERSYPVRSMIKYNQSIMEACQTAEVTDAAIVLTLQQVIHYKIASYGAVCTYAKVLGVYDDGELLHQLLDTEKKIDRKLVALADLDIDRKAFNYDKF